MHKYHATINLDKNYKLEAIATPVNPQLNRKTNVKINITCKSDALDNAIREMLVTPSEFANWMQVYVYQWK